MAHLGAIILCGGESRRMGHPKPLLPLGRETLLARSIRLVGQAAAIVVAAAPGQVITPLPQQVILTRDRHPGRGPLEGLTAGLEAMPPDIDQVFATAVDSPFLVPRLIDHLAQLLGEHEAAIPLVAGRLHPLSAVYRREPALQAARALLDQKVLKLSRIAEVLDCRLVSEQEVRQADPELSSLTSVNTPEEYEQALALLGERGF